MISAIVQPEKRDVSYEFDLPVMVVNSHDPDYVIVLNKFHQDDDGNFAYYGYIIGGNCCVFNPVTIYDYDIKNWSKFKGKVMLSNFAENE